MHFTIAVLLASGITILMPEGNTTTSWSGKQRIRELVDQCSAGRNRERTLAKLEEYFEEMSGGLPWLNREIVNNKVLTDTAKRRLDTLTDLLVMDLDNDGNVTRFEIRTFKSRDGMGRRVSKFRSEVPPARSVVDELVEKDIQQDLRADTNHDDTISAAEIRAQADASARQDGGEWARNNVEALLMLDPNGDKSLSLQEFTTAAGTTFDQMDINGDGELDKEEKRVARVPKRVNARGHYVMDGHCFTIDQKWGTRF